ncbi:MAG TPA: carboxypeptidase-like regulatory domain-containing protein, partial [Bryobacteraceae bacterium]|nr:carboxypeptidase-like regulatory domain-containing protein [Bryobacteraceae bacterium]
MRSSKTLRPASSVVRATLASVFLLIMPVSVLGQSSGGAIRGTITDPSGAVIQGAAVTIVEHGTGETRRLQTNSAGLYDAPNLPIGTYQLTAMAIGFSTAARTGIEVRVGSERVIDLALTIGPAGQTVTAISEPASVDLATSETGAVETGQVVRELPLNGR